MQQRRFWKIILTSWVFPLLHWKSREPITPFSCKRDGEKKYRQSFTSNRILPAWKWGQYAVVFSGFDTEPTVIELLCETTPKTPELMVVWMIFMHFVGTTELLKKVRFQRACIHR
ncbi:hypothetical protein TNCT_685531 [Trichonephila clavata]|uniref:Secreted protein n=1 Tax=Trichonephila clavata TaxID=2740835 RepID=A0A8X6KN30_TRICU|nr:hypothetical protein TNCT_685531 [Trichonephila clavata]